MPIAHCAGLCGLPGTLTDVGETDRTEAPSLNATIVKLLLIAFPLATSVARSVAICVVALTGTCSVTTAKPF
jgi:hypothetical protein